MGVFTTDYRAQAPQINRQNFMPGIGQSQSQTALNADRMNRFADTLRSQAAGNGPNPALAQLQQTTDQNMQNASALMASQHGVNPLLAARAAATQATQANQQAVQQAALLRARQQLATQQQLGQVYGTIGEQGLQQQQILQGANAAQNNAINTGSLGAQQINAGIEEQNTKNTSQFLGGLVGGGATALAALSDRRQKTNIKDGDTRIEKFLDVVKPKAYDYKDERFGKGTQVSPMAQDLEKTPVGKAMVMNTPSGKMVDYGKGLGAILAATADIHHRLKKIEESKGAKRSA